MAVESGGGGGDSAAEMLELVIGLLTSAVEDERSAGKWDERTKEMETTRSQIALIFDAYSSECDNSAGEKEKMIDEQGFIQLLSDFKLLQNAGQGAVERKRLPDKIERVQAIELFRMSISSASRAKFFIQHQSAICDIICIEDFYNCCECLALMLEPEGREDQALPNLLNKLNLF